VRLAYKYTVAHYIYKLSVHVHIISTNIRWYHRFNYINLDIAYNSRTHVPTPPILHNTCKISYPLHLLPPHCIQHTQVEYSWLVSFFHLSTWRWPMKSAETCSCSLCNKLYTYLHHHVFVLDKYVLYPPIWFMWNYLFITVRVCLPWCGEYSADKIAQLRTSVCET